MSKVILIHRIKQTYGENPTKENINTFVKGIAYLCRMYWMNRTDKINKNDLEIYWLLTNEYCNIEEAHKLKLGYKPLIQNQPLFNKLYSHSELEHNLIKNLNGVLNAHFYLKKQEKIDKSLILRFKRFLFG